MARIKTYAIDTVVTDEDIVIGSDGGNSLVTRNYRMKAIKDYVVDGYISNGIAQVKADWSSLSGASQILNKPVIPTIPTNITAFTNDAGYLTAQTPQVNADWSSLSGASQILNKPIIPTVPTTISSFTNDAGYLTAQTPQVNSDWSSLSGVSQILNKPTNLSSFTNDAGYLTSVSPQVNSDWDSVSGVSRILNKPQIPAPQVNSDWNSISGVSQILNKPVFKTINSQPITGAGDIVVASSTPQVNSDWDSISGVSRILNKPVIPVVPTNISAFTNDIGYLTTAAAQVNSDWNSISGVSQILNKPVFKTINNQPITGTGDITVTGTEYELTLAKLDTAYGYRAGDREWIYRLVEDTSWASGFLLHNIANNYSDLASKMNTYGVNPVMGFVHRVDGQRRFVLNIDTGNGFSNFNKAGVFARYTSTFGGDFNALTAQSSYASQLTLETTVEINRGFGNETYEVYTIGGHTLAGTTVDTGAKFWVKRHGLPDAAVGGGIVSITGTAVNNTDPLNPVINVDGSETKVTQGTNVTITGTGTTANPYVVNAAASGTASDGSETKVTQGTNVTITGTGTTATPYVINSATQVNSDWNSISGVSQILNKPTIPTVPTTISSFTNDAGYLTTQTPQVNSDWNSVSGVSQILNKPVIPTIPTNVSYFNNDAGYVTAMSLQKEVTTSTYTILPSDLNYTIFFNNATGITVSLNTGLPANFECDFYNLGAGTVAFISGTATLDTPDGANLATNKVASLIKFMATAIHKLKGELA